VEAARLCLDKNKCEQALSISNKILRQQPDHSEAYALRGQSYGRTGDYTAAIADLRRATQLDPENGEHHFNLALAYLHSGDPTAAADTLERVLSLNPHDEEALALYGRLTQQSEASDAEDSEQIPDEEPSQGEIFFVQGEHKKAFKEWDREIAAARKARDFKGQARLLLLAGKRYFQVGRGRKGERYLNQGLKLAQQEEDLVSILEGHVQLLFLALSEQRWQVLMQHARQLLAIGRALDVAAYEHMGLANLGMAYGQTGRVEEGVRLIAQARDIAHQVGDKANEAVYCHQLGHFYVNLMRKFPRYAYDALEMFERAQRLQSEMGARPDPDLNGLIRQLRAALYG
jgi:tetratricopeptide (TPR) repeat protein